MGTNEITGAPMTSKIGDQNKYHEGYDRIFGKKANTTSNCESVEGVEPMPSDPFCRLQPHQQRVVKEAEELKRKVQLLKAFIDSETFKGTAAEERVLLPLQLKVMLEYLGLLNARIDIFMKRLDAQEVNASEPEWKIHSMLSQSYLDQGQFSAAARELLIATRCPEADVIFLTHRLGDCASKKGDLEQARVHYVRACMLDSTRRESWLYLADLCALGWKPEEELKYLQDALSCTNQTTGRTYRKDAWDGSIEKRISALKSTHDSSMVESSPEK